ncbi:unnamed protein product [Danaus chrysippus]|uniref:(African queen) hypothetical protein n=1 Tax=Danaus chrysippus TaxID=151541 RepID=A0A8J2QXS2_9NEOP|nr:unnamed protein product [Danaus chrysippus]
MEYLYIFALVFVIGQVESGKINLPQKEFYKSNDAEDLFMEFVEKYNKNYNEEEYARRFQIFKENLEKINDLNSKSNLTVYGINHLTDLKYEEVANTYTGMGSNIDYTSLEKYVPKGFAPASLDYRNNGWVTGVKDQKQCNTCYIFSAVGCIEGQHAKLHGTLVSLSEQQELDCQSGDGCQSGGYPDAAMNVLAQQGGCMSEDSYPYEEAKGQCRTDPSKIVVKVTGGSKLTVTSEDDLKDALANNGPLSIALIICPEFQHYSGGIYEFNCQGNDGHAVLLVGYDSADGQEYWILKNSWATIWGEEGYMRMKLGSSICNIGKYVALASVA